MRKKFLAMALVLLCLSGCGAAGSGSAAPGPSSDGPAPAQQGSAAPVATLSPSPAPTPTPSLSPRSTPEPTPTPVPYYYGLPVEESEEKDVETWFADAVFLGDSRTEGMQVYSGIRTADFIWHRGMSVFNAVSDDYRVIEADGEKLTLLEALALKQYGKVYIMIGVNELGYAPGAYEESLGELLDRVRELQPDAVIYLQTIPPVNEGMAQAKGLKEYINNANVNAFNEAVVRQARARQVALLDVASVFRTEEGDLAADMAADGVHFRKEGYRLWTAYLLTHTLDREAYLNGAPAEEVWSPLPELTPEPTPGPTPEPSEEPVPEPPEEPSPAVTDEPAPEPSEEPAPSESQEGTE